MTRRQQRRREMIRYGDSGFSYKFWDGVHSAVVYSLFGLACLTGCGLYCVVVQCLTWAIY